MTPEEILAAIKKAAIATATGGQLTTEQAKAFIDLTVEQNKLLSKIQTVQMQSSTYQLNTIDIANRIMRKAVEGTDPGFIQGVTITPRELSYIESIIPYDVTFSFLEENIEGQNAESKINQMFAKSFGNNLIDLAINGDTSLAAAITDANADGLDDTTGLSQNDHSFLIQNDGWLKIARNDAGVHTYTLPADLSTTTWKAIFKNVLKKMPSKWKGNPADLVLLVSPDVETEYRDELGERATPMGDQYTVENRMAQYQGINVEPIPFWPGIDTVNYPVGPVVVLTKYQNLAAGIGRNMRVGRFVNERKRVVEYTITAKTDFNYVVSDLMVLAEK